MDFLEANIEEVRNLVTENKKNYKQISEIL